MELHNSIMEIIYLDPQWIIRLNDWIMEIRDL